MRAGRLTLRLQLPAADVSKEPLRLCAGRNRRTFSIVPPNQQGRFPLPAGVAGKARPDPIKLNRVMAYNATVQHQLTNSIALEIGYVGNAGRNMFAGDGPNHNANQARLIP